MSDNRAHSRFGGSVCPRYVPCPGSVPLVGTLPAVRASERMAEGSVAHKVAEDCLKRQLHPTHFLGEVREQDGHRITVTQEMCDAVVTYLNIAETEMAQSRTAQFMVEQSFAIDVPGCEPGEVHGANDLIVYHPELKRVRVFDYKHGKGNSVSAEGNAQLKFYALGAILTNGWPVSEIILTIVQPRALDVDKVGAAKDWTFSVIDLLEFQGELEQAIALAKAPAPPLNAGPWCSKTYCPAAGVCPARDAQALTEATVNFEGVKSVTDLTAAAMPDPRTFDKERLSKVVTALEDILIPWANQAREYLDSLVLGGEAVPGWKAVEKIGRAKWIDDPAQVVGYASMLFDVDADQLTPRRLVTIGDAEKLLKAAGADKAAIDDFKLKFTLKESSGLTVAPASDKRPAVDAARQDFAGVNLTAIAIAAE